MAVEYRLTLAGETPIASVAARALPDAPERVEPYKQILTADLAEVGLDLTVNAGRDGYLSGEDSDNHLWEWEPAAYVNVTLTMTKDPDLQATATRTHARHRRVRDCTNNLTLPFLPPPSRDWPPQPRQSPQPSPRQKPPKRENDPNRREHTHRPDPGTTALA